MTSAASGSGAEAGEAAATGPVGGEADPLASNGLGSPLCRDALGAELSAAARSNCENSGFVAARAPTGDYGLDVHIDTGVLGFTLWQAVQDLFVAPLWTGLVWAVHALVVMLEWCFTIDLLDSGAVGGGVARGLREVQSALTDPWLASVLAVAAVLAAYNGLVRRRVAETVGQALLALAMMAGGMWVIVNPAGTVGALGGWANEAGLGTLAVTTHGTPARAARVLANSMGTVFAAAIEVPWCYLEFGDVGWCRNPARMDQRLRAAGLRIAEGELALIGCKLNTATLTVCVAPGSAQAKDLEHSAALLRHARSNGAVFLALPANGSARNSINAQGSLLRVICESSDATSCRGPAAAQAQFRTSGQTWARVGGLVLIAAGVLGMLLLLGFIALRLLAAALFSLLYLMLAPAAVLAPALGEAGRAAFRKWAVHLLGAVVSKLLFSFLLGVILAILAILANLEALGWWTQWLLMSAFWWGAYARRHQVLETAGGALGRERTARRPQLMQRLSGGLDQPRRVIAGVGSVKRRFTNEGSEVERARGIAHAGFARAEHAGDEQSLRLLEHERREAHSYVDAAPGLQERMSLMRSQLDRVRGEQGRAVREGDTRRAAELAHRAQRIDGEVTRQQHALTAAHRISSEAARAPGALSGDAHEKKIREKERFLDAQAALPPSVRSRGSNESERRDYPALAGLAGYGRHEFERMGARAQRGARLEIDRELAMRSELNATARQLAADADAPSLRRAEQRQGNRAFENTLEARMRDGGQRLPSESIKAPGLGSSRQGGPMQRRSSGSPSESAVMRDAREVAARRKRQLGRDRS